jgi:hypothetical protein
VRADSVVFLDRSPGFRSLLVEHGEVVGERVGLFVPSSHGLVEIRVVAREVTLPWCEAGARPHPFNPVSRFESVTAREGARSITLVAEQRGSEGEFESRTRVLGVVESRVFLTVQTSEFTCLAHGLWQAEFVVFDVETMTRVHLEHDAEVQAWGRRHPPEPTCEEGCLCEVPTSLSVLYPRCTADGTLRATAVFLWGQDGYVCSGEWGAYSWSEEVRGPAPPSWLRAYQPLLADANIAMEGQRGRLLGATSLSAQRDELRAAFAP